MQSTPSNASRRRNVPEIEISVTGLDLVGHHGATEIERTSGVRLSVEVCVRGRFAEGIGHDRLEATLDYRKIEQIVRTVNRDAQYTLIESFANAVASALLAVDSRLTSVLVRVCKNGAPGMGDGVMPCVKLIRERS